MQEQELFETYELKGWNWSKRLYQILGVAVIFNVVVFVLMAQANFLTGKTCDSPIASGVCSVLDTLYVGGMILDADGNFVSKDYDPTEIGDADEITYVNLTDYAPLTYPVGYFALANPDQLPDPNQIIASPDLTGITTIPTDTGDLIKTSPVLPPDNGSVLDEPLTGSPLGTVRQGKIRDKKSRTLKTDDEKTADKANQNITSEPLKLGEINRVPFEDAADDINEQRANNQIDLTKNFEVEIEGTIKPDGKFDPKQTKFVKAVGDEQMLKAAKAMLIAMGDSGFLAQLQEKGIERVKITLVQNDTEINATLSSDLKTSERAATASSGLNTLLQGAILLDNNGLKKLDETSKILVSNSTIKAEGKTFKLDFKLPKQDAQVFIIQALDKRAEKKKQPSSSGEVIKNTSTNTGK